MPEAATAPLTIVIPTYDRPLLVRAAVLSALSAIPEGGEVIVVDDHSRLPAAESLADLARPGLRVLLNGCARGPAGARNFGVGQARSGMILFLDDDDLMVSGYPAHLLDLRRSAPHLKYGFSAIEPFADGREVASLPEYVDTGGTILATLTFRKQVGGLGCGFWIMRDHFLSLGGIAEDLLVNEDTDFSCRLLAADEPGWFSDGPGVWVRQHSATGDGADLGNLTRRTGPAARAGCFWAILLRNADWLAKNRDARRHILKRLLKMQAKAGLMGQGLATCRSAAAKGMRAELGAYFVLNIALYRFRRD